MKAILFITFLVTLPSVVTSQELTGLREKIFPAISDTIILDTSVIVPGSLTLWTMKGEVIHDSLFSFDPAKSQLIINTKFFVDRDEFRAEYRVFTVDPGLELSLKDSSLILQGNIEPNTSVDSRYIYLPTESNYRDGDGHELVRSGSISRGITFGNNQDLIVNSNLNLQLSGKLDDNINILASISDQNIPLQPEGYSQQLHEFDNIFIRLFGENYSFTAGDIEIETNNGIFLPLRRKAQGITGSVVINPVSSVVESINTTTAAALSRGKYHRNSFKGTEGNQGPYKLKGSNNEPFIIILAGSEMVYIDGVLLNRGIDRDYIIDYNLAEITFTSNMPITKDKRISVEFEYSDRSYTRFMLFNTTEFNTSKGNFFINFFSENDARNQPLQQELSDSEKEVMAGIGDSIHLAWIPGIDSMEFRNDLVLYEKKDTLVNGQFYTIYQHSIDPDKAHFRLSFSNLGENNGNYLPEISSANGRVFKWVAPVDGQPTGTHEPVTLLTTPESHQVISIGGNTAIADNTLASFEIAMSDNDINTFSKADNGDNRGMALRTGIRHNHSLGNNSGELTGEIQYEYSGKTFTPVQRYKSVEFDRDWNTDMIRGRTDEHKLTWNTGYRSDIGFADYTGEYINYKDLYRGLKNSLNARGAVAGFNTELNISYLNSEGIDRSSGFLRHHAELSKSLTFATLGIRTEGEHNEIRSTLNNELSPTSFAHSQHEFFIRNSDTSRLHLYTSYRLRNDKLPFGNNIEHAWSAREISSGFSITTKGGNSYSGVVHHRILTPDSMLEGETEPENSLNGRMEADITFFGGLINTSMFYETGSGLELKRDFIFIEVPGGQGTHSWTDYNNNGIKEINEFNIAQFPDQAEYIKIFIPGDEYLQTRSSQLNQNININFNSVWDDKTGLKKILSLFYNQTGLQVAQKSRNLNLIDGINPFYSSPTDSNMVSISSSIRNTLSFQRTNTKFGVDYLFQKNESKGILVSGFESRQTTLNALHSRVGLGSGFTLSNRSGLNKRAYYSDYFSDRDYNIRETSTELDLAFRHGFSLLANLRLKYSLLKNSPGNQEATKHNIGADLNYNVSVSGSISLKLDYIYINYDANVNTPLAWEILGGLQPGKNITWSLHVQQNLRDNLQLSINYNGRTGTGGNLIHTGGVQVRAYF